MKSQSYEDIYEAHYGAVLRLCRLLLAHRQDAEEITQEVFLKVHQEFHGSNAARITAWRPWLVRVSVNACRDRRRSGWWKRWGSGDVTFAEANYPNAFESPEESLLSRETQARIHDAFRGLSARQREVFTLRYVEEWSTEEVAQMLGITTGSVKRYLFRAVRHMRAVLGAGR